MKPMPKVSVILTSYNHGKYLREAIDSVLKQTFADFELIIWDDASSDNSWDIITTYVDPRIKAFRNEEQKRGTWGINKAIAEVASGDYIAIHHSDDVWEAEKLEKQVAFLDLHPDIGAVFTRATAIAEDGSQLDTHHWYSTIFDQPNRSRHEWLRFFFRQGNALCHPSVLIRKVCYKQCGLYRFGFAQVGDFDMWVRVCLQFEIHILPDKLIRFRVLNNEANASGNRPEVRTRGIYELYKVLQNYRSIEHYDDLVKVFPSAHSYDRGEETDVEFALAMMACEEKPFTFTQLFGVDLLFEAISDRRRSVNLERVYGFNYKSFVALTAKQDVFSLEEVRTIRSLLAERDGQLARLTQAVAERDGQIANLNQAVAERDAAVQAIKQSNSWKITVPLRAISSLFKPTDIRGV